MDNTFRCIVTSRGADGRSRVAEDREVPPGALGIIDFWATDRSPAPLG